MYVVVEPCGLKGQHLLYLEGIYHHHKFWCARYDRPSRPELKAHPDWPPTRECWSRMRQGHPARFKRVPAQS